jgi:hypothetical protein
MNQKATNAFLVLTEDNGVKALKLLPDPYLGLGGMRGIFDRMMMHHKAFGAVKRNEIGMCPDHIRISLELSRRHQASNGADPFSSYGKQPGEEGVGGLAGETWHSASELRVIPERSG